ncbi:hypothetical protein FN846DRAFT_902286 [Sphaerosporella brunnea]|uniref:Uncharacterized protein n=1 Tax=Sphaerosporella brunnea TaxID=1250544 RepID=A0A5J5FAE7_9PEZI|nr:hypothetical protein FN846DRAFT_902286 [Sphaerosporella brunnea]
MSDAAPHLTSLYKASLQRPLAELAFLNANAVVSDDGCAAMKQSLAAARQKLRIGRFVLTCAFAHVKKDAAELKADAGQQFEVLDDDNKD